MARKFKGAKLQPSEPPIAHAIRFYAVAKRLENKDLALAWGCNESTVSRFLSGKMWPDGQMTGRIVAWLFGAVFRVDHCESATGGGNGGANMPEHRITSVNTAPADPTVALHVLISRDPEHCLCGAEKLNSQLMCGACRDDALERASATSSSQSAAPTQDRHHRQSAEPHQTPGTPDPSRQR